MSRRNRHGRSHRTPQQLPIGAIIGRKAHRDDDGQADAADDVEQPEHAADLQGSTESQTVTEFLHRATMTAASVFAFFYRSQINGEQMP